MSNDELTANPLAAEKRALDAEKRALMLQDESSIWLNVAKFEQFQRVATMLSKSDFVPARFKGNVGNCMIALDMAALMNMHVLMLMRTMYVVHGEPGFEGKFVSALINNSRRYKDPLEYEWKGEKNKASWGCRAYAVRRSTDKIVYGPWVDWEMVQREGWHKPKGSQASKWTTMTEIMFMYRAASFFGKTNDSDLLMGMQTVDELEDISADLTRRPDGKYAMPSSEKQTVSYAATAQAPTEKSKVVDFKQSATPETGKPHLKMPDPVVAEVNYDGDQPIKKSESAVDEFGTPTDSPFEKSKWFHLRAGSPNDGTGFAAYVKTHHEQIASVSQITYNAMFDKYKKLYNKDFPWSPHGHSTDIVYGKGAVDPEITEAAEQPAGNEPGGEHDESSSTMDPAVYENEKPVLETDAARILAGLAGKHKREYVIVVKNRTPESVDQIHEWIEAINQLVVDHAQQPPQSDSGHEKF